MPSLAYSKRQMSGSDSYYYRQIFISVLYAPVDKIMIFSGVVNWSIVNIDWKSLSIHYFSLKIKTNIDN